MTLLQAEEHLCFTTADTPWSFVRSYNSLPFGRTITPSTPHHCSNLKPRVKAFTVRLNDDCPKKSRIWPLPVDTRIDALCMEKELMRTLEVSVVIYSSPLLP